MRHRTTRLIVILLLISQSEVFTQSNPYDGFSTFYSGQGARNVGLSQTNGAEAGQEFDSWSVNPANLSPSSWSNLSLNSTFYAGGIRSFELSGLVSRDSVWPIAAGLSRTGFGQNTRYDIEGNAMGEFQASITQLSLGTRRQLSNRFYVGVAMNYDWRVIDFYNSHVLHFSLGGIYEPDERRSYGITLSDLGYEIVPFETNRHDLPLDLSLFWRQELNYLPFTFFLRLQKLNLWNRLTYNNPFQTGDTNLNETEEIPSRIKEFTQEVLRHMVFGGEFAFGRPSKVWLRFSYDHWRNQQLGIPTIRSLEGVALGFGVQLKPFRLDYTWERLYFDSGSHQISLYFHLFEKDRRQKGF